MQSKGIPKRFWQNVSNQRALFDNIAKELKIIKPSDWYKINRNDIATRGGGSLLRKYYNNSLIQALHTLYPEHQNEWMVWLFGKVPKDYWRDSSNQRAFFDWAARQLNISDPSHWYKVTMNEIQKLGGSSLLYSYYGNSLVKAVTSIYSDYPWKIWLFHQVPRGFWEKESNVVSYLQWLSDQLGVKRAEDWLYVSREQLECTGAATLLDRTGGFRALLEKYLPEVSKLLPASGKRPRKTVAHLHRIVKQIFPENAKVYTDYHHPKLVFPTTNRQVTFDLFVSIDNNTISTNTNNGELDSGKTHVALEYQGEQHYMWHYLYGSPDVQKSRDEEKLDLCKQFGIHLIQVPFWWDRSQLSLVATIAKYHPHVFKLLNIPSHDISLLNSAGIHPIPQQMPPRFMKKHSFSPVPVASPEEYFKSTSNGYTYHIKLGRLGGTPPKCRSCRKILQSSDARIEAHGVYAPPGSPPYPAKYSFCLSPGCVTQMIAKSQQSTHVGVCLPPWKSVVGVKASLHAQLDMKSLQQLCIQMHLLE